MKSDPKEEFAKLAFDPGHKPGDARVKILRHGNGAYVDADKTKYEYDFSFRPAKVGDFWETHTTAEMMHTLEESDGKIELEARILARKGDQIGIRKINGFKEFKEAYKSGEKNAEKNMRESADIFALGGFGASAAGGGTIGQDFIPLLGGPYFKNLYYYQDYLRMHMESFFAFHHDPMASAISGITTDFVLGRGYEIQCDESDPKGKGAKATWSTFEKVNNLQQQVRDVCNETGIYGEIMLWKLPTLNGKPLSKIVYMPTPGEPVPVGVVPRVRLLDPSNIVEIVTTPEDITRPLFYVWLTPTQYQIYTSGGDAGLAKGSPVQPTLKFIYQTIPASEVMHYRVNAVSNEKRGRSDYFPVLGYLKQLRDSVGYSMAALQKVAAWSIDTQIDGDQTDIDNYVTSQQSIGTIPPSASEFVHSTKIKREYLGNSHLQGQVSDAFLWNFSMICMGVKIPANYFGTHLAGGQTRAGAIVATEPVAKKMESRRLVMRQILQDLWDYCMTSAGMGNVPCQIIFPEIITQDRSQKLKDLQLGELQKWFSHETVSKIAAKEFGMDDYNYQKEMENIAQTPPSLQAMPAPLTGPGLAKPGVSSGGSLPPGGNKAQGSNPDSDEESNRSVTSNDRVEIKKSGTRF